MKKGYSYITITDFTHPNHKLIKALKSKGINNSTVIYASMYATDAGWTLVTSDKGATWLGYTIAESLILISKMTGNE